MEEPINHILDTYANLSVEFAYLREEDPFAYTKIRQLLESTFAPVVNREPAPVHPIRKFPT